MTVICIALLCTVCVVASCVATGVRRRTVSVRAARSAYRQKNSEVVAFALSFDVWACMLYGIVCAQPNNERRTLILGVGLGALGSWVTGRSLMCGPYL